MCLWIRWVTFALFLFFTLLIGGCNKTEQFIVETPKPISLPNMIGIIDRICFSYDFNLSDDSNKRLGPLVYVKTSYGHTVLLKFLIQQDSETMHTLSVGINGPRASLAEIYYIISDISDEAAAGNWLNFEASYRK